MLVGYEIRAAAFVLLGILWAGPSLAEASECFHFGYDADGPGAGGDATLGKVSDLSPRVNFVKRASVQKSCPNNTAACQDKAYLVPGDEVVVTGARGEFVCATYVSAKGRVSNGWLPRAAVTTVPEQPQIQSRDWLGTWRSGPEQEIVIGAPGSADKLTITGDASWGASDPEKVKTGSVHMGELNGEAAPRGAELSFGMGENGTVPYDKAEETDCRVQMRRLGSYLLVRDNNMCGGANVSFTGVYRR